MYFKDEWLSICYRYNSNYFASLVFPITIFLHIELSYVENAPDGLPSFYTGVF